LRASFNERLYREGSEMKKAKDSYAVEFARKGGKARAKKLTVEERRASAKKAAEARWAKRR
jgi:hypothetical protein